MPRTRTPDEIQGAAPEISRSLPLGELALFALSSAFPQGHFATDILGGLLGAVTQQGQAADAQAYNEATRDAALAELSGGNQAGSSIARRGDSRNTALLGAQLNSLLYGTPQPTATGGGFSVRTGGGGDEEDLPDGLSGGLVGRFRSLTDMLEGLGTQARKDIDRTYSALEGNAEQDVIGRGLAGASVLPSLRTGITRERADARARLDEQLRREQMEWRANLSRDFFAELGSGLSKISQIGISGTDRDVARADQLGINRANVRTGFTAEGPPPPNLGDTIATLSANDIARQQAYNQPSAFEQIIPGLIGAGSSVGSTAILADALRPV